MDNKNAIYFSGSLKGFQVAFGVAFFSFVKGYKMDSLNPESKILGNLTLIVRQSFVEEVLRLICYVSYTRKDENQSIQEKIDIISNLVKISEKTLLSKDELSFFEKDNIRLSVVDFIKKYPQYYVNGAFQNLNFPQALENEILEKLENNKAS